MLIGLLFWNLQPEARRHLLRRLSSAGAVLARRGATGRSPIDKIWTLSEFLGTTRELFRPLFFFYSHGDTFICAPAPPHMRPNGRGAEVREGGSCQGDREKINPWKVSQVQVEVRLRGGKVVPGALEGMDAHVKEGQLYVQHQKFGKVSSGKKLFFGWQKSELLPVTP